MKIRSLLFTVFFGKIQPYKVLNGKLQCIILMEIRPGLLSLH